MPPTWIKPQLAALVKKPPEGDDWLHEIKFDARARNDPSPLLGAWGGRGDPILIAGTVSSRDRCNNCRKIWRFWGEATMDRREFIKTSAAAMAAVGVTKSARATTWKTIDAQVHSYERNHPERPWAGTLVGPDEMTGDQMVAAMDAVGVDAAVLVSPFSFYRYDPSYVLEVEGKHPDRFCLVKPVDPTDPAIAANIADWKAKKGTVGVRLLFQENFSTDPADPGLNRVLAAAAKNSLAVNVQAPTRLDQIAQLAARNPDTQIVIDHLGLVQPFEPPIPPEPWANLPKVLALATYPNVAIKITGACTLSHEPFPYKDIWEPLGRIFSAFTLERCLWGTDWTRAVKLLTYKEGVDAFRMNDKLSDSDKAKLMGGTASKIYKWSPGKA